MIPVLRLDRVPEGVVTTRLRPEPGQAASDPVPEIFRTARGEGKYELRAHRQRSGRLMIAVGMSDGGHAIILSAAEEAALRRWLEVRR